jgi:hypothetical protein
VRSGTARTGRTMTHYLSVVELILAAVCVIAGVAAIIVNTIGLAHVLTS